MIRNLKPEFHPPKEKRVGWGTLMFRFWHILREKKERLSHRHSVIPMTMNEDDLGLKRGMVRVVPYRPEWPAYFQSERELLQKILGAKVLEIRHIGSTAIPGMPAKPIIDILSAVENLADVDDFTDALAAIGYEDKGNGDVPGRRYFVKGSEAARTHHLNFYEMNSPGWIIHILFCEYLKAHDEVAKEYAQLKLKLAKEFPTDRASYTNGKEKFVAGIVEKAARENQQSGN
jgi:GrpB-like predicted nucleotidyltransferase (UPF0157 family)